MKYGRYDPHRRFRHPDEALALDYLEKRGHILLRHNFHVRFGEIDLISCDPTDGFRLHAVEVKSWHAAHDEPLVHPLESLNARKRAKMRRAMEAFRQQAALAPGDFVTLEGAGKVGAATASEKAGGGPGKRGRPPVGVDEPAWILARAGCPVGVDALDVSFDLLWIRVSDPVDIEFFPDLF